MLDKTVPYFHVVMRRRGGLPPVAWDLPDGFVWAPFQPGDERLWARIETAVGEFATESEAHAYFRQRYGRHSEELPHRCVFVCTLDGHAVRTVTSWWDMTDKRRDASLQWLAVLPDYQGRGLGKALVSYCLARLVTLEGDRDIFLHTQTWSHRAIAIYLKAGFAFSIKSPSVGIPTKMPKPCRSWACSCRV